MLTPQEVAEHGFSKSRMGGYNMKEVDDFLDELTADFSELYKENAVLKGKIKVLAEKISEYRETEDAMRTTLLTAQKMANSMVVQAEEEKKRMIAEAERAALQRKAEVEQEVADAEYQLKMAKNATAQFVEHMRELVKQEASFLDQLPAIKAEPVRSGSGQRRGGRGQERRLHRPDPPGGSWRRTGTGSGSCWGSSG